MNGSLLETGQLQTLVSVTRDQWFWPQCSVSLQTLTCLAYNSDIVASQERGGHMPPTAIQVVTVTEALVLHPLLEDRGHITESIRILVPVDRMKQKCFQITMKRVRRSQQFQFRL